MNAQRRKKLANLKNRMTVLMGEASSLAEELAELRDEESSYFDAMPVALQSGDRGQKAESAISAMENVIGSLEDFAEVDADELDTATA